MRKTFKLDELDCANCGAKIEAGIKQIEGVNDAKVLHDPEAHDRRR